MSIEVLFNILLEQRNDRLTARYYQIGILDEKGFSGLIRDYVGGGQFDEIIFIDGLSAAEFLDEDDVDDDLGEETLDEHKPGVLKAIEAFFDEHFETLDEGFLIAPKAPLLKLFQEEGEDLRAVLSNSEALEPIEIGNTSF